MSTNSLIRIGIVLAAVAAVAVASQSRMARSATAAPGIEDKITWDFTRPEGRIGWMHITPGSGNVFTPEGARLSNRRGRTFLLNILPQPADRMIEATVRKETGSAFVWLLFRWKDANNFYEVALKEKKVEVWRKQEGKYIPILRKKDLVIEDASAIHTLRAQLVGAVPAISVWVDGRPIWSGKDDTGLRPLRGDYVALETEFSSVHVNSVSIGKPE